MATRMRRVCISGKKYGRTISNYVEQGEIEMMMDDNDMIHLLNSKEAQMAFVRSQFPLFETFDSFMIY